MSGIRNIGMAELFMRLYHRLKGHHERQIREEIAIIYEWDACPAESVKYWVCEDDSDEIYPTHFSESWIPPCDIAKAISQLLNKRASISRLNIAESPKVSCKSVKRTLGQVFARKKFGQ
jgi:protein-arginine kinase activator protein McsA